MQPASLTEIKKELQKYSAIELLNLCMSLTKYKKDNKEFVTYAIFHSDNLPLYLEELKKEMDLLFEELPKTNIYIISKKLRKILRLTNKQIKHTLSKKAEAELLIYYCKKLKASGINFKSSTALTNLYNTQLKKINNAVEKLHEDLQYDYQSEIESLSIRRNQESKAL